jgi:hypothetical protein
VPGRVYSLLGGVAARILRELSRSQSGNRTSSPFAFFLPCRHHQRALAEVHSSPSSRMVGATRAVYCMKRGSLRNLTGLPYDFILLRKPCDLRSMVLLPTPYDSVAEAGRANGRMLGR